MALRNKTIHNIINNCKYYYDIIERPSYLQPWVLMPSFTYNKKKRCRQLEEKRLIHHPNRRTDSLNYFNYKNNLPRKMSGIGKYVSGKSEHFQYINKNINKNIYRNLNINLLLFIITLILSYMIIKCL